MRSQAAGILIAAVSLLTGCSAHREASRAPLMLEAQTVIQTVQERHRTVQTLTGSGTVTIETPEASQSGSFDLVLRKPDSLRVDLSGPFGIRVGTLALARDRFVYYSWMENTVVVGMPDAATFQSLFRLRMEFDEVLHTFTGEFAPPPGQPEGFSTEERTYVLRYRSGGTVREYRVDGDTFCVTSYRMLDSTGRAVVTAIASDPDEEEGVLLPRLVRLIFPAQRRSITVAYDDIRPNEPVSCSFAVPARAEVIER